MDLRVGDEIKVNIIVKLERREQWKEAGCEEHRVEEHREQGLESALGKPGPSIMQVCFLQRKWLAPDHPEAFSECCPTAWWSFCSSMEPAFWNPPKILSIGNPQILSTGIPQTAEHCLDLNHELCLLVTRTHPCERGSVCSAFSTNRIWPDTYCKFFLSRLWPWDLCFQYKELLLIVKVTQVLWCFAQGVSM